MKVGESRIVTSMLLTLALVAGSLLTMTDPAHAASTCILDGDGTFVKEICIVVPEDGATVSGTVTVTGTVDPVNGPRTQKVEFYIDGGYVLTDFRSSSNSQAIFDFELPTEFWVDGVHRLEMLAITRAETGTPQYATQRVGIDLVFDNGITVVPANPNTFTPSEGRAPGPGETFTIAATADGASGETNAEAVADMLVAEDPNMFLYSGDVYEKGTRTEFHNWYGDETRSWGRLRPITNPTVGNHEYEGGVAPGYFDYWDNISSYYSFDVAGWHVVSLNSTNGFRDNPEQFKWMMDDLAANSSRCTIALWHHPAWSIGTRGDTEEMHDEWAASVEAGVDVVIGGNDHNYQRWEPLGPAGQLDEGGAVNFVVGTGGHGIRPFAIGESEANPRVARASDSLDAFGALFLELNTDHANFRYLQTNGVVLDEGTIECNGSHKEALHSIASRLGAALPTLSGTASQKADEALNELTKALNEDKRWDGDGSLDSLEGKGVFDKMKRANEKLLDVTDPPAPIVTTMNALVALGEEMAQSKIDEAVAADGDPEAIAKAVEHMAKAQGKIATGELDKAVDEYKKAWEGARAAFGDREDLRDIRNVLDTAIPGLSGKAKEKAKDAVKELDKALNEKKWWEKDNQLDAKDGKEVYNQIKRAVAKLMEVKVPPAPITTARDDLVGFSRDVAQAKIDEAIAEGGDSERIAEALEKMAKAEEKLTKGEFDRAIEEFKKAWEKA